MKPRYLPVKYKGKPIPYKWYFTKDDILVFGYYKDADRNMREIKKKSSGSGKISTVNQAVNDYLKTVNPNHKRSELSKAYHMLDHWEMNKVVFDYYGISRSPGDPYDKVEMYKKVIKKIEAM